MEYAVLMHLLLIKNIGPAVIEKLVKVLLCDEHGVFSKNIYEWLVQDFVRAGISEKVAYLLYEGLADDTLLHKELELCHLRSVNVVTLYDKDYPLLLKNTHLPPPVLYYKGDLSVLSEKKTVALVGSRKANHYGKTVVDLVVPGLITSQVVTVSGGAYGIDTLVHESTLKAKGSTVAVLGSGLLKPYPASNKKLFEHISQENGLVMSPFPLLMEGLPGNFPARNRIIAGLSQLCVVIQAAQKSGALITADYALQEGRSVGAVPGPIDDELSYGCYKLLSLGARLISSSSDILEELSGVDSAMQEHQQTIYDHAPVIHKKDIAQKVVLHEDPVVQACRKPKSFEDLCAELAVSQDKLKEKLFTLQLEGKIEQNFAGLWYKL